MHPTLSFSGVFFTSAGRRRMENIAWIGNWKIYAIFGCTVLVLVYLIVPLLIYLLFLIFAVIAGVVLALLHHPDPYKRRGKNTFPDPPIPMLEAPLSRVKPYPPPHVSPTLFSVNVDSRLQEVLNLTLKHHVVPTYDRIAKDQEAFFNSVVPEIWNALAVLVSRMGQMDTMKLLTNDVVEALKAHFQHFRGIHFQDGQMTDRFPNLLSFPYLESPEHELLFLRQVSEVLLCVCLPKELLGCTPVRVLIREYLACRIFQPTIEMVCSPDYINQKILAHLIKREEATKSASKRFAYSTYEDFMKHIEKCEDLVVLEETRQHIITDILQAKAVHKMKMSRSARLHGGQFPISISADKVRTLMQRDLDVYITQLGTAKTRCERQIRKHGGQSYLPDLSDTMKEQEVDSHNPPPGIPFETIMKNEVARTHLSRFMERCGFQNWLRFWIDIEALRTNPAEDIHKTIKGVFEEYLSPSATSIIHADPTIVESIHLCLLTESQPAASCLPLLFRIQESVYIDINNLFYQNFINSEDYRDLMTAESNAAAEGGGFPPLSHVSSLDLLSLDESHHKTKLKTLKQQLEEKTDELSLMPLEVRTSSNLAMRKKALEKDRGELQEEIKKLEHYIEHTEEWFGTVGQWSIEIQSVDIPRDEKNNRNPLFILVVHRPEAVRHRPVNQIQAVEDLDSNFEFLSLSPMSEQPHGLESIADSEDTTSTVSTSELSDESSSYHSKTGWVLGRHLSEFEELHKKLVEICPELQFPPIPKRFNPFQRLDAQSNYWDRYRIALQSYLCRVLQTERLQESEEVFNFISSASDIIRKTPLPERKNPHRFSLSSVPVMGGMFTSSKDQEEGKEDSVADNMYLLFSEIFELDQWSRVLRKQLVEFVQLTYGKSIDRELQESLTWAVSEPMLIFYLETFRDAMWPGGQPAPPAPTRSDEQKAATKEEAKKRFLKCSPQALQTILGQRNSQIGFQKIFESLQDARGNKQLFYSLLEVLLYALVPELKKVDIESDDHMADFRTSN